MKKLLLTVFLLCACASAWAASVLIDVHTPEEFSAGHLKGAVNIDYTQIAQRIGSTGASKDDELILYCHSGRRAGIALDTLKSLGYKNVKNYGGMSQAQRTLCSAGSKDRKGC